MTSPTSPHPAAGRIERFEAYGYGLFVHFGLYSASRQGEWTWHYHRPERADYVARMHQFTAAGFDAPALAAWAKAAGMRYICLTSRHHEGFSFYDTTGLSADPALQGYDSLHAPAGRDLVREFVEATRAAGLGVFIYHTTLDWWHPDFDTDFPAYLRYLRASVERVCTQYGKIDGLWFDGNWSRRDRDWEEDALYRMIRRHQPDCMIINNSSTQNRGAVGHPELDALTFEQGGPSAGARAGLTRPLAMERCETMNSHWGIADHDYSMKSPAEIIGLLCACRREGANLLLNIGPNPDGSLPAYERATLELVGRWINEVAGDALYAGRPTPGLKMRAGGFVLQTPTAYHAFVSRLSIAGNQHLVHGECGDGWQSITGDLPPIKSVRWTDTGEELRFVQHRDQNLLSFLATSNPYGRQVHVRVARLEF